MRPTTLLAALLLAAACLTPGVPALAKDLRAPPRPPSDQSYLYVDPGETRPNLPGYMQESMDPVNDPDTGTMFGQDEQDEAPDSFGLND
jgi:hypothetical protein